MKFASSSSLIVCAVAILTGGITGARQVNAEEPGIAAFSGFAQEAAQDNTAAPNVARLKLYSRMWYLRPILVSVRLMVCKRQRSMGGEI